MDICILCLLAVAQGHEADIQAAPGNHLLLPAHACLSYMDDNPRILPVKIRIYIREHVGASFRRETNGKGALFDCCDILQAVVGLTLHAQHLPCGFQIDFPGFCRGPAGAGAVEQRRADIPLQVQQLLVQGGRGDKKLFRCPCHIAFLGYFHNVFNFLQVHGSLLFHSIFIIEGNEKKNNNGKIILLEKLILHQ